MEEGKMVVASSPLPWRKDDASSWSKATPRTIEEEEEDRCRVLKCGAA
jgi:hypothetical protein